MLESFLHFLWRYRRFDLTDLRTTDQQPVEILSIGEHNRLHAGPDFLGARIKIGNIIWAGHVEIHIKSSDWQRHGHQKDQGYDNVVLHVVLENDKPVLAQNGQALPCLELKTRIQSDLWLRYKDLSEQNQPIACGSQLHKISDLSKQAWLERLTVERLEERCTQISALLASHKNDWEKIFWMLFARSLSGPVNADPMQWLMEKMPLPLLARLANKPLAIEALLLGQAGLLPEGETDAYTLQLKGFYADLKHNHHLVPQNSAVWKYSRMRPSSFPAAKLVQLSAILQAQPQLWGFVLEANSLPEIKKVLQQTPVGYWQHHVAPNKAHPKGIHCLGEDAINRILINAIAPLLFWFGKNRNKPELCDSATAWLETIPPEDNHLLRDWQSVQLQAEHAADSQALYQLRTRYCDKRQCLHCAWGVSLLRNTEKGVNEEDLTFFSSLVGNIEKEPVSLPR